MKKSSLSPLFLGDGGVMKFVRNFTSANQGWLAMFKKLLLNIILLFAVQANAAQNNNDFGLFLNTFTENIEFQKAHTKIPIEKLIVDSSAEPEPKPIEILLPQEKITFPIIPNKTERTKNKLSLSVKEKANDTVKVVLFKEDTGWLVFYIFKKNSIWQLVRIEDWSI